MSIVNGINVGKNFWVFGCKILRSYSKILCSNSLVDFA